MFIESNTPKTRKRAVPGPQFSVRTDRHRVIPPGTYPWVTGSPTSVRIDGTQVTESVGNPWPPRKGIHQADIGSEFFTQKTEVMPSTLAYSIHTQQPQSDSAYVTNTYGNSVANCFKCVDTAAYWGQLSDTLKPQAQFPPDLSSSKGQLVVMGTKAIAAVSPSNSIANVASSVGELLQDLPAIPGVALWESRLKAMATVAATADEFLNYVFAISPTLGDMTDFLKAVHNIDKAVDQFIRDSGRVVRREFHFPQEQEVEETVLPHIYSPAGIMVNKTTGEGYNVFNSFNYSATPFETIRTRVTVRDTWFSGAFTYHLPGGFDTHSRADRRKLMAQLFGAKPDLNTLWQLAPWSWAVDWVSDAGAFVSNLQSKIDYGTVLRYGYVMETTTTTDTYSVGNRVGTPAPSGPSGGTGRPFASSIALRITTKKRVQANPFGFGLSWDGLSTVQKAIVAALGITRVVR